MKRNFLLFCFILLSASINAQSNNLSKKAQAQWKSIKSLYSLQKYELILPDLEKFVSKNSTFLPARKTLVELYLQTNQIEKSADVLNETIQNFPIDEKNWYSLAALVYQKQKKYTEAITALEQYKLWPKLPEILKQKADEEIMHLQFVRDMIANPVPFEPLILPGDINTENDELYPVLNPEGDRLFFTRKEKDEDLYQAELKDSLWTNVQSLTFNTKGNEGAQSISADGRLIVFTACNRPGGLGSCDIYYTMKVNGKWTTPSGIGQPINTIDWESQPCIAANGRLLIFSAIRSDGFGGKDLYVSYLNKANKWTNPKNIGNVINTKGNEETPFLHPDGKTLYFTSDGHQTIGAKDIFMSKLSEDGRWTTPVNLGYPINTENDDAGLFVAMDGIRAYFSSNRAGGKGKLDIYYFDLPENVRADKATYVKAIVKDITTKLPIKSEYNLYQYSNDSLFTYGNTDDDGSLLITIPANQTFRMQIDKKGYLFYSEQFVAQNGSIQKPYLLEVFLSPVQKGASTVLKNVLFKTDSYELQEESFAELLNLVDFLNQHPNINADIIGHTDDVGTSEHNLKLSKNRAQSVVDYLVEKGIDSKRLKSIGMGETQPITDNKTAEGRSLNRRTEFKIEE